MARALREHWDVTDDASLLETCGVPVRCIPGREEFFKVTFPEDAKRLETTEARSSPPFRIGHGYDIHRFAADRPLILGGVKIRETDGLLGHSDADVLIHAAMDALLGAAGLPDIGHWFPDTDEQWEGVSSLVLLEKVRDILDKAGYRVGNLDVTVLAEAPKLAPHKEKMKENLADALRISPGQVSVKATTNEKLGAIGREEGIAAMAVALLFQK